MSKHSKKIKKISVELRNKALQEDKDFFIREWKSLDEIEANKQSRHNQITN